MSISIHEVSPPAPYNVGAEITITVWGNAIHQCRVTRLSEDPNVPPSPASVAANISGRANEVKVGPFDAAGTYSITVEDQTTSSESVTVTISSGLVFRPVRPIEIFPNLPLPTAPSRNPPNTRTPRLPTRPGREGRK